MFFQVGVHSQTTRLLKFVVRVNSTYITWKLFSLNGCCFAKQIFYQERGDFQLLKAALHTHFNHPLYELKKNLFSLLCSAFFVTIASEAGYTTINNGFTNTHESSSNENNTAWIGLQGETRGSQPLNFSWNNHESVFLDTSPRKIIISKGYLIV